MHKTKEQYMHEQFFELLEYKTNELSRIGDLVIKDECSYVDPTLDLWDGNHRIPTIPGKLARRVANEKYSSLEKEVEELEYLQSLIHARGMLKSIQQRLELEYGVRIPSDRELWEMELDRLTQQELDIPVNLIPKLPLDRWYNNNLSPTSVLDKIVRIILARQDRADKSGAVVKKRPQKNAPRAKMQVGRRPVPPVVPAQPAYAPRIGERLIVPNNKNFQGGEYEIVGGGYRVSRHDARKIADELMAEKLLENRLFSYRLYITSWNRGMGHYVVLVPIEKCR